jgi:hypothetical protein
MATAPSAIRSVPQDPEPAWLFPQPDAGALGAAKYCFLFVASVRSDLPNAHIMVNGVTYLPQCGNRHADYNPL